MPTVLLLAACLTDVKYKKVLNTFVFASLLVVIASHLIVGQKEILVEGLFGLAMAFVLVLPLYLVKALGAADIKIFAVFGLATNVDAVIYTFVASMIWSSVIGIVRAIFNKQGDVLWSNFIKIIKLQKPEPHTLHKIPYTVALLVGWFTYIIHIGYGRIL